MKTASHSDPPLKGHVRFCVSHFGPFFFVTGFNAICTGACKSLLDLIFKKSDLAFECSALDEVFSFALAVMWTTVSDKNQNFQIIATCAEVLICTVRFNMLKIVRSLTWFVQCMLKLVDK